MLGTTAYSHERIGLGIASRMKRREREEGTHVVGRRERRRGDARTEFEGEAVVRNESVVGEDQAEEGKRA